MLRRKGGDNMSKELFDRTGANEDEFFYNAFMTQVFTIFSPFEIDREIVFPKKDELGGVVLKFIGGGGACYFKIQREMPSPDEVQALFEIGQFLQESFGDFIILAIVCTPDIEIRDINVIEDENITMNFASFRKSDGIATLDLLIDKLESSGDLSPCHHVYRLLVPYMGRSDEDEFDSKYSKFIDLFNECNVEQPSISDINKLRLCSDRWFSDDFMINFCNW